MGPSRKPVKKVSDSLSAVEPEHETKYGFRTRHPHGPCGFPLELTFIPLQKTRSTIVQLTGGDDGGGQISCRRCEASGRLRTSSVPLIPGSGSTRVCFVSEERELMEETLTRTCKFYTSLIGVCRKPGSFHSFHFNENANDVNKPLCSHPLLFKSSVRSRR